MKDLQYYLWGSYRRKILDRLLEENKHYYRGTVLDIGGRNRGNFKKPKDKVSKWIFADIEARHNPDIILDVTDMRAIKNEEISVINTSELFEHVKSPERGLKECFRVLKKNGYLIMSVPYMFPVHNDPHDYQRYTETKWKELLEEIGFTIEKCEIMGRYFTVLADMIRMLIKSIPKGIKYILYLFYPILDLLVKLDNYRFIQNHTSLGRFHGGYFIIVRK
jgi:SAM-dependent methyltransferase